MTTMSAVNITMPNNRRSLWQRISNWVARRDRSPESPVRQASREPRHRLALFAGARNTRITNATIFNIQSPTSPVSLTMQDGAPLLISPQHSPICISPSPSGTNSPSSDSASSESSISTPPTSIGAESTSSHPATPSRIYRDHLQRKGLGHPLWIPGPNERLSAAYRESGVMIGDVGIITPDGAFSFLFSVFYDATYPRNSGRKLPPNFIPFTTSADHLDIEEFKEFDGVNDCYLAADSLTRVDSGEESGKITLSTSASQGAALMLPETVHVTDLQNIVPLRNYIKRNLHSWYKLAKDSGRDIKNGDIRVVHSCRKTTGYGIAAVSHGVPDVVTELTFSVLDAAAAPPSGCRYRWSHKGCAVVKAGPSPSSDGQVWANQCLFIGTVDFKLSDKQWMLIEEGDTLATPLSQLQNCDTPPSTLLDKKSGSQESLSSTCGTTSNYPSSRRPSCELRDDQTGDCSMRLPSDVLADFLLSVVPCVQSVSISTEDWGPYFTESVLSSSELIGRVLSKNEIFEEDGTAFFRLKGHNSDSAALVLVRLPKDVDASPEGRYICLRSLPLPLSLFGNVNPSAILNADTHGNPTDCDLGAHEEAISRIEQWRKDLFLLDRRPFWLSGEAGSGKSTIAESVSERCRASNDPVASFFFSRGSPSGNLQSQLVPTLLSQLLEVFPGLESLASRVFEGDPQVLQRSIRHQFTTLMDHPVQALYKSLPVTPPVLLIIGGVDKYAGQHDQETLLHIIHDLVTSPNSPFIAIVASRPESHITSTLNSLGTSPLSLMLEDTNLSSNLMSTVDVG